MHEAHSLLFFIKSIDLCERDRQTQRQRERVIRKDLLVIVHSRVWKLLRILLLCCCWWATSELVFYPFFPYFSGVSVQLHRQRERLVLLLPLDSIQQEESCNIYLVTRCNFRLSNHRLQTFFSLIHCQNCFSLELSWSCWSAESFES